MSQRIITFTTDFGLSEHYVGAMKGVILSIFPEAELVDISNAVQSFDILDGAITIAEAYDCFPSNTIHLVVVDPGVGTDRRPLLVTTTRHLFIAPDNGVLSLVYAKEERVAVRHITAEHYFRQPVSQTFHGRDIFASVAGHLSKGVEPAKFGEEISDYARFAASQPKPAGEAIKGVVIKVDKFGNLITNFTPKDLPQLFEADSSRIQDSDRQSGSPPDQDGLCPGSGGRVVHHSGQHGLSGDLLQSRLSGTTGRRGQGQRSDR